MNNTVCRRLAESPRPCEMRAAALLFALLVAAAAGFARERSVTGKRSARAAEPWTSADLIQIPRLTKLLSGPKATRPTILCVGFPPLYDAAHIPGARFAGPADEAEGLAALKKAAERLSRGRPLVIYCGCCPFRRCPNVRPAFKALGEMGFKQARVLVIEDSFAKDWVGAGLPVEKAGAHGKQ